MGYQYSCLCQESVSEPSVFVCMLRVGEWAISTLICVKNRHQYMCSCQGWVSGLSVLLLVVILEWVINHFSYLSCVVITIIVGVTGDLRFV